MKWVDIGVKLFPLIVGAIQWVEQFARGKGRDKQDAVIELVKTGLSISELVIAKDLLNDDDVVQAARKVIDAYVALQNVIASKAR